MRAPAGDFRVISPGISISANATARLKPEVPCFFLSVRLRRTEAAQQKHLQSLLLLLLLLLGHNPPPARGLPCCPAPWHALLLPPAAAKPLVKDTSPSSYASTTQVASRSAAPGSAPPAAFTSQES